MANSAFTVLEGAMQVYDCNPAINSPRYKNDWPRGHAHWCNSGMNIMGVTNTFWLDLTPAPKMELIPGTIMGPSRGSIIIELLNGHSIKLTSSDFLLYPLIKDFLNHPRSICLQHVDPQLFKEQRIKDHRMSSLQWTYIVHTPSKVQGSLQNWGHKKYRNQRQWMTANKLSSGHSRAAACMNLQKLWQHAQILCKL